MSSYRLYIDGTNTDHRVAAKTPAAALRELCAAACITLASQDRRYGRTTDGRFVMAMTEPYGRRRLDPFERTTRIGAPR